MISQAEKFYAQLEKTLKAWCDFLGWDLDYDKEKLATFTKQVAPILPSDKKIRSYFAADLISATRDLVFLKGQGPTEFDVKLRKSFLEEHTKNIADIDIAMTVVPKFLTSSQSQSRMIKKLLSDMSDSAKASKEALNRIKHKGPQTDMHESGGLWFLVTLFDTFLQDSKPFQIQVPNANLLESEQKDLSKKTVLATGRRLTLCFLDVLKISMTEQVIRKRVMQHKTELLRTKNLFKPSEEYPTAVVLYRKRCGTWVDSWKKM